MSAEIPDSIIAITTEDGNKFNTEEIEAMQRQLQAVMAGDYTKIPTVVMPEGVKIEWIDFTTRRNGVDKIHDYNVLIATAEEQVKHLKAKREALLEEIRQDKSNIDFYKERAQILQQQMEDEYIRRGGTIPLTTDAE